MPNKQSLSIKCAVSFISILPHLNVGTVKRGGDDGQACRTPLLMVSAFGSLVTLYVPHTILLFRYMLLYVYVYIPKS